MQVPPLSDVSFTPGTLSAFPACNPESISFPQIFGTTVTSISAVPVADYSASMPVPKPETRLRFSGLNFCTITVSYTHPGRNDNITVSLKLPASSQWNGRFLGVGGGGWSAGFGDYTLIPGVDQGFAVASTDAGVTQMPLSCQAWALESEGVPDYNRLATFASHALHELAEIGKHVVASYYEQPAAYSYWTGCSQGGRQGHMLAQRYPHDFDGIAGLAPAINWGQFFPAMHWGRVMMNAVVGYVPSPCEMRAFQAAAVQACDGLDGVVDGIVTHPERCTFDPNSVVGQPYECEGVTNATLTLSAKGAQVVRAAWTGPRGPAGEFMWYGYPVDADIGMVPFKTTCAGPNPDDCAAFALPLPDDWLRLWVAADPSLDLGALNHTAWANLATEGIQRYDSIIGTRWADLSRFRDAGGKLLNWHGTADPMIPYKGSVDYYERVRAGDANVNDYYRLFLAPGVGHCSGGAGPFPVGVMQALMAWVENGTAPEVLVAQNVSSLDPVTGLLAGSPAETEGVGRPLCAYPKEQVYVSGDASRLASFRCEEVEEKSGSSYLGSMLQQFPFGFT